ncbi:unnamed protein product [Ixodes pacificus]
MANVASPMSRLCDETRGCGAHISSSLLSPQWLTPSQIKEREMQNMFRHSKALHFTSLLSRRSWGDFKAVTINLNPLPSRLDEIFENLSVTKLDRVNTVPTSETVARQDRSAIYFPMAWAPSKMKRWSSQPRVRCSKRSMKSCRIECV